jgi:hypothetical protein
MPQARLSFLPHAHDEVLAKLCPVVPSKKLYCPCSSWFLASLPLASLQLSLVIGKETVRKGRRRIGTSGQHQQPPRATGHLGGLAVLFPGRAQDLRTPAGRMSGMEEGLLPSGSAAGKAKPFPVCSMFGLLAFGFAYGELISNFGLIMLPAEADFMEPANNAIMMTFLLFVSGISQFSGPLAGYYSDRCQVSWGRRRPYLLAGTIFTIPALVCMWYGHLMFSPAGGDGSMSDAGSASSDDHSSLFKGTAGKHMWGELLYIVAFLVAMAAFNVQNQTLGSLISDMVPPDQTGQANGVMAVLMLLGSLLGFLVFRTLDGGFGTTEDADGKPGALHFLPIDIPVADPIGKM